MAKKKFAPLASQETLDTVGQKKSTMIEEPWRREGFTDIPRSEQIVQIFTVSGHLVVSCGEGIFCINSNLPTLEVVDKMIKTMKEGVRSSQRQVEGLQRRMER